MVLLQSPDVVEVLRCVALHETVEGMREDLLLRTIGRGQRREGGTARIAA
jgi:hypothetical protein